MKIFIVVLITFTSLFGSIKDINQKITKNKQNISNEQLLALLKLSQSKAVNRPTSEINPAPPNPQQRPRPPPAPVDQRKQKMYNDLFKNNF